MHKVIKSDPIKPIKLSKLDANKYLVANLQIFTEISLRLKQLREDKGKTIA